MQIQPASLRFQIASLHLKTASLRVEPASVPLGEDLDQHSTYCDSPGSLRPFFAGSAIQGNVFESKALGVAMGAAVLASVIYWFIQKKHAQVERRAQSA
jgi:hypothetical protein